MALQFTGENFFKKSANQKKKELLVAAKCLVWLTQNKGNFVKDLPLIPFWSVQFHLAKPFQRWRWTFKSVWTMDTERQVMNKAHKALSQMSLKGRMEKCCAKIMQDPKLLPSYKNQIVAPLMLWFIFSKILRFSLWKKYHIILWSYPFTFNVTFKN